MPKLKIGVIGGGPAGMLFAATAAGFGHDVTLFEQNEKLGKKLYITGKGRCNITNLCDEETLIKNVVTNPKFMYSSFYTFPPHQVVDFFESHGVKTKVERGNRVFPLSDKSSDVIKALSDAMIEMGVKICLNTRVTKLSHDGTKVYGLITEGKEEAFDRVIVATGGYSYQMTGSRGDGYHFAKETCHKTLPPEQALVPFNVKEDWVRSLQGLSLKNVVFSVYNKKKVVYEELGEMMFTHFGVTGPVVLSASSFVKNEAMPYKATIDLKPGLSMDQLDDRLLRDFAKFNRKDFANALDDLLPSKLIPILVDLSQIDPRKKVDQITKEERSRLLGLLKGLEITLTSKRSFNEAIITKGGVDVKEINPNTMMSKKIQGLYFIGEVLDVDALTGGFNLQVAFSTAYLAAISLELDPVE